MCHKEMFMSEKEPTKKEKQQIQNLNYGCLDMMMNAPIGIFTSTPDGRFVDVNPAMARMFGYDSSQEMMSSIENMAVLVLRRS
jgi:PAS domain-containing protein